MAWLGQLPKLMMGDYCPVSNENMRTVAKAADCTISLHILLPIAAGVLFAALCVAGIRQNHVIDIQGWSHPVGNTVRWGEEPADIGTPADGLLLALNLPALIALLPLSPLAYL